MTEIGVIATIMGVAGAGFRLSLVLNAISCEVANMPQEIHHVTKTITLFASMLKQTGKVLQEVDSVHSPEAAEAAQQVSNDSTRVFDEITEMLDRVRTRDPEAAVGQTTVQQRFRKCFRKQRLDYLIAQLESLKLSLSLLLQILSLGKMMAMTSKTDSPEVVNEKIAMIQHERMEAQNLVIIRFNQKEETEQLWEQSNIEHEPESPLLTNATANTAENTADSKSSQLTTIGPAPETPPSSNTQGKPAPEIGTSTDLVKLPLSSLGEVDDIMRESLDTPSKMLHASGEVIDPLLDKWTHWHRIREERHARQASRYRPNVDSLFDEHDDIQYYQRYQGREASPQGNLLEGTTTDWRRPHSMDARQEAARLRKHYARFQPSISAEVSEAEDSQGSNMSKPRKRTTTRRHVINSSSESSDTEDERRRQRKDSGVAQDASPRGQRGPPQSSPQQQQQQQQRQQQPPAGPTMAGGYPASQPFPRGTIPTPYLQPLPGVVGNNGFRPNYPPNFGAPRQQQNAHRPYASPDQHVNHHAYTTGSLPPLHTGNAINPYARNSPGSPGFQYPPGYGQLSPPQPSPPTTRGMAPPRPVSKEGRRSPSSLSRYSTSGSTRTSKEKRRHTRAENLKEGATKGLLGAGAIAGFLEALEGLSL